MKPQLELNEFQLTQLSALLSKEIGDIRRQIAKYGSESTMAELLKIELNTHKSIGIIIENYLRKLEENSEQN